MISPCKNCPWKKSTRSVDIPGDGSIVANAAARLSTGGPYGFGVVMQCHAAEHACAGFVVQVGPGESVALRFAAMRDLVDLDAYTDGGHDLHATVAEMVAAHPAHDPGSTDER